MPAPVQMRINHKIIRILPLFGRSFREFKKNDPLRMAGATSFFATFALPAVLIILIQTFGLFVTPRFMSRQLFNNLGDVLGTHTAVELRKTLLNVRHLIRTWYEGLFGFLFLIFVATTLLKVVKDSLNQLWDIRLLPSTGLGFNLLNRVKSLAVILFAGLLFLFVLLAEGALDILYHTPEDRALGHGILAKAFIRQLISLLLVSAWFFMLLKFLPDAKPRWRTVLAGAVFTGLLFTLGKLLLSWLLSYSNMQTIYGASTSSVLLLLFVFYSSFIFYFGACFTKIWAAFYNDPIQPGPHAEKYQWSRVRG
jgi:membrane protein